MNLIYFRFSHLKSPLPGLPDINNNTVVTVQFKDPFYEEGYNFLAQRLPNAVDPPQVIPEESHHNKNGPIIGKVKSL